MVKNGGKDGQLKVGKGDRFEGEKGRVGVKQIGE
jgi:hypothetical protein